MSNAFTNFLSSAKSGYTDGYPILKDYQHASRLYVDSTYARAPKFGFLYYVQININPNAVLDKQWLEQRDSRNVGLLAKKADLPKFNIATETLNQYNRKTVVQTKLSYAPISIELHDDNSDITQNLWVNYYKHYYADSNYSDKGASKVGSGGTPESFRDTKYGTTDYSYGRYDNELADTSDNFITSIDIFVLHQQNFTQYTLINPKITEWSHDNVNQSEGGRVLQNKMQVAYENVLYTTGTISPGKNPETWVPVYYDNTPSPFGVQKNPFAQKAVVYRSPSPMNPVRDIATILAKNYLNKNGVTRVGAGAYNIAAGVLGAVTTSAPGKYASPPSTQSQPGILQLPGGIGINIFKGFNTSVDGSIRANPAAIIFPPRS